MSKRIKYPHKIVFRIDNDTLSELIKLSEKQNKKHSQITRQALIVYLKAFK